MMGQLHQGANQLFVGGTVGISKQELRDHFGVYGTITSVRFAYDRVTGRRRNYGFVHFKDGSSAQQALQISTHHNIAGRIVTVQPARLPSHPRIVDSASTKPQPGKKVVKSALLHNQNRPWAEESTNFRHKQPQRTPTPSPPTGLTLLDLLHHVPALPQLLSSDARKALSAANRSFRECFVSQIRIVTVPCRDDTSWIRTRTWPLLSMVIQQNQCFCGDLSPRDLVRIRVAGATMGNRATILVIRPMHTVGSESVWATWAAQQLAYQVAAKFPNLQSFEFMPSAGVMVDGQALSMSVVAQITKGSWSSLTSVGLQDCSLGSQGLSLLAQADWPVLKSLDVSGNRIDAGGMAILVKGNWPSLTKIVLSSNPSIDAVAIAHLSAARWPLEQLKLDSIIVTAAGAAELARLQLPSLNCIWLHDAGLTAAAMSGLVEADWPRLSRLSLSCNNLGAAMQHFFKMQLPALEMLYLTQANLTDEGAHCLALGHWPFLTHLDLDFNNLNAKGVKHIACGMWPRLQRLTLVGNSIGHGGAQQLTKGDWPLLRRLRIGLGMLKRRDSAVCLGLDPDKVQGFESDTSHLSMCLERDVSQSSGRLWPDLSEIAVWKL